MSTPRHTPRSSHALHGFLKGDALPYTMEDGVRVVAVTPKDGVTWGSPIKASTIHLIDALAGAWTEHGLIVGARWKCGGGSIGAQVYRPEQFWDRYGVVYERSNISMDEAVCAKCRGANDSAKPCVYRLYDKAGALLYIGSTKNWANRSSQHRAGTWWWPVVKEVDLTHYESLADARAAEAAAIGDEAPRMNVMHNRGRSA